MKYNISLWGLCLLLIGYMASCATVAPTPDSAVIGTVAALSTANAQLSTQVASAQQSTVVYTVTPLVAAAASPTPSTTATPPPMPSATPTPTALPARTARPTPEPPPSILSFLADPPRVNRGDSFTLRWTSTGGVSARLQLIARGLMVGDTPQSVPPSGSKIVTTQSTDADWHEYELVVYNRAGVPVTSTLTVRFYCSHNYFFPFDSKFCPSGPAQTSPAAEQLFERGRMVWLGSSRMIYVLLDQDRYATLQMDTWTPGEPESDPSFSPPPGRYQPIRGFGKVWRNNAWIRDRIGWALGPERGFETTYQEAPGYEGGRARCIYLRLLDTRVVSVCGWWGYTWRFATQ